MIWVDVTKMQAANCEVIQMKDIEYKFKSN